MRWSGRDIKKYSEIGVDGFPAAASQEHGEKFYQAVLGELEKVVGQIRDERLS